MSMIRYRSERRRSGPVFFEHGARVYEVQDRLLAVSGTTVSLPKRNLVYIIDADGVNRVEVGADPLRLLGILTGAALVLLGGGLVISGLRRR